MAKSHLAGQAGSQSEKQGDRKVGDGWRERVGDRPYWMERNVCEYVCLLFNASTHQPLFCSFQYFGRMKEW